MTASSEASAQYRHFDALPLGLSVIRGGRVVYANSSLLQLLERPAHAVVGCSVGDLFRLFPEGDTMADRHLRRMRGELVPAMYESSLRTSAGERRVELSVTLEGPDAVVILRDVSARAHQRSVLQSLAELGAGLPGMRTEQEVLARVFQGLEELGFSFAYVHPQGGQARLERLHLPRHFTETSSDSSWAAGITGQWSALLERTWKEGSAYDPEFAQEASRFLHGELPDDILVSLAKARLHVIGVRIEASGLRRAVLALAAPWLREEELAPLRLFGAQVSAALEAALTISQLSAQNTALSALNRLASTAATAREPKDFFEPGAEEITRLLGCDTLGLFLRKEHSEEMELVFSQGLDAISAQQYGRMPVRGSLSGQAMEQGEAMVLEVEACSEAMRENMLRQGYTTVAVVPLRVRSRLVGTLVVAFRQRRGLAALERETLQAMGSHFAAATESHRLLTEVRQRAEALALIHEVSHNMVATLEMGQLLQNGVMALKTITRSKDAFLLLLDARGVHLEMSASVNHPTLLSGRKIAIEPTDSSASARALHARAPVRVEDALNDPGVHHELRRLLGVTALLALPLVVRGSAVGVALMIETAGPRLYTDLEVERASAITNQLALALEQARLVERLKKSVADLEHTQAQLVLSERMAAIGELAATVAHEVRNPLGAIFNSISHIRGHLGPTSPAQTTLAVIAEEADRINNIVADLLHYGRPSSPSPTPLSLPRMLEEAVGAAVADAPGKVKVQWALEGEVTAVADERMMGQVFLNLALNAAQAMSQGGTLRVAMRRLPGPRPEVQVEFTDTGPGISPEVRARIFEPFFTTKAKGTGLGLAIVKRNIESHAGRLVLESEPGQGTTFRVVLPCEPEPAQQPLRASL